MGWGRGSSLHDLHILMGWGRGSSLHDLHTLIQSRLRHCCCRLRPLLVPPPPLLVPPPPPPPLVPPPPPPRLLLVSWCWWRWRSRAGTCSRHDPGYLRATSPPPQQRPSRWRRWRGFAELPLLDDEKTTRVNKGGASLSEKKNVRTKRRYRTTAMWLAINFHEFCPHSDSQ